MVVVRDWLGSSTFTLKPGETPTAAEEEAFVKAGYAFKVFQKLACETDKVISKLSSDCPRLYTVMREEYSAYHSGRKNINEIVEAILDKMAK